MNETAIREITPDDLPEVAALLHEGFPSRSLSYWRAGNANLQSRTKIPGYPQFGFVIVSQHTIQGVILLLTADLGNGPRSNLSSWYVRPAYRKFATFLFQQTLRVRDGVFLNLSPSARALPIATAFGFKPYTAGVILLDARAALGRANGNVVALEANMLDTLPCTQRSVVEAHLSYGCSGLLLEDMTGTAVALYRVKMLKGLIPCAQFLFGNPKRLLSLAGPLMRALMRRCIPMALIDSDGTEVVHAGTFFRERSIRYLRGEVAPQVGDLLETELAIFGP